jgi:hypothetical protein
MSKKELAEKLGFNFEEVKDILSEETMKSFEQNEVKGGEETNWGPLCASVPPPPPEPEPIPTPDPGPPTQACIPLWNSGC